MKKTKNYTKIFLINLFLLFFLLLLLELSINFINNNLFEENKFFFREKLINQYDNNNVDVAYAPYKLLNKNNSLIPLSGISNTKTILCKHNKEFITYNSDQYGFNNDNLPPENDIIMLGDSYVHGLCQKKENTLVDNISRHGLSAINFGMMSTGPLIQYATLKEYAKQFKYNSIIWLFNPDNDFYDFSNEIDEKILLNYFINDSFNQNLINNDINKNIKIYNYFDYKKRKLKEFIKFYHLDLKQVRDSIQIFINKFIYKKIPYSNLEYLEENNVNKIIKLINSTINYSFKNEKNLIFVINAISPDIVFSKEKNLITLHNAYLENIEEIKKFLKKENIIFFDFNQFIYDEYNNDNIGNIFKITKTGIDHYTANGNKVLAKKITEIYHKNINMK